MPEGTMPRPKPRPGHAYAEAPGFEAAANGPAGAPGQEQEVEAQVQARHAPIQDRNATAIRAAEAQRKRRRRTRSRPQIPQQPEQRVGEVLNDTYRIQRLIATGGMGAVYEVDHTRIQQRFAVKFLDPSIARNAEVYARFRQEAEIAAKLNHKNVVQVFDFNTDRFGNPYMVMELVKGRTLDQMIREGNRFSRDEVVDIFEPLCKALDACHKHGIVHRDLKPSNIIVEADYSAKRATFKVKLLDFGISKIKQDGGDIKTRDNVVMGTPNYMSPEQAKGDNKAVEGSTDIFALGSILYEMLSGRRAFEAEGLPQILHKIVYENPPALSGVPAGVSRVVERCLEKAPEERFANATDIVAALKKSYNVLSRPSSDTKGSSLRPWIAVGWLASLALAAGVSFAVSHQIQDQESKSQSPPTQTKPTPPPAPRRAYKPQYPAELAGPEARILKVDDRLYRADRTGLNMWTDAEARPKTQILPSASAVLSLSLSSDRKEILVGQADGSLSSWDLNLQKNLWTRKDKEPADAVAVGNGYLATASGQDVRLVSLSSKKTLRKFNLTHPVRDLLLTEGDRTVLIAITEHDIELIDADRRRTTLRAPVSGMPLQAGIESNELNPKKQIFWIDFHQGDWTVRRSYRVSFPSRRKGPHLELIGSTSHR